MPPTVAEIVLRTLILWGSGVTVGLALVLGWRNMKDAWTYRRDIAGQLSAFFALLCYGVAGSVYLIMTLVFRAPGIPPDARSIGYAVSLTFIGVGMAGMSIRYRAVRKARLAIVKELAGDHSSED